jgi:DNA-binding CsgD family transcriptional regulator
LDKTTPGARFSAHDSALAAHTLRGIKWFHRQLLLGHGLVAAQRPLTASERRVVRLLLTEQTEKEIAQSLGLGFDTTHKRVTEIYRKFGVRSRTGLMALWLGGRE